MAKTRAIVLVGSRWHAPWEGGQTLIRLLDEEGIEAIVTDQGSILHPDALADVALLVFYCEGRWDPAEPLSRRLTPEQEAELDRFVTNGGGLVGVHGATVFREEYDLYPKVIGGRFVEHAHMCEFTVKILDPAHPVCRGVSDYTVFDEPYVVDRYAGSDLLLAGEWDGQTHPLGWAKTHGRGRVCYLANGHDKRSLEAPPCTHLFRNAARWCAGL